MRIVDTLLVLIGLAGLAGLGWWSMNQMPNTARTIESELQIAAQNELQRAGLNWAQVTMDGQVATVRGTQPNQEMVTEAVQTVLTSSGNGGLVYGGVTVVNSVIDVPAVVSPYQWSAQKAPTGDITLAGHVPSDLVRNALVERAEAAGAMTVTDTLSLGSGVPGDGWQTVAERGLDLVQVLDEGEARLRDTALLVRGRTADTAVPSSVARVLAALPEPFTGEADIRGPGRWTARHFRDQLIFTGDVETEDERAEILEIAGNTFSGEIVDEMTVGTPSYSGWMDGIRLGLPHFTRFLGGEMAFDPEGDGYRFQGEASGSTLRFLSEDLEALEGPHAVSLLTSETDVDVAEVADVDFDADPRAACETAFAAVLAQNKVVFETASSDISRESGETLDKIMAVSGQCDPSLVFELGGHTDNSGSRAGNLRLSSARAEAVADYMIEAGIDPERLLAVGYGPDSPVADNGTPEGRAANRRLEIKVLKRSE